MNAPEAMVIEDPASIAAAAPHHERVGRLRSSRNAASGLLDAGFAALSSFLMGTAVVRLLDTSDLALFSSMFAGFVLCALLPTQLVYVPSQLDANTESGRIGRALAPDVLRDLRQHWPTAVLAAVAASALGLPLAAQAGWEVYGFAAVGMFALALASPHQSHTRGVLHVVGRHGGAALVSAVTFAVQLVLLVAVFATSSEPVLRPGLLGLLLLGTGVANALGSLVALALLRGVETSAPAEMGVGTRIGFLGVEAVAQAGGYASVLVVTAILGTHVVARLEAARVVASPVQILVVGLLTYLAPDVVRAVGAGDRSRFRRSVLLANTLIALVGAAYALLVLVAGGVIGRLLGRTVEVDLAASRAAVTVIDSTGSTSSVAMLTLRRVIPMNAVILTSNAVSLAVLPFALLGLGAIGMPVAQAIGSTIKAVGMIGLARRAV